MELDSSIYAIFVMKKPTMKNYILVAFSMICYSLSKIWYKTELHLA